MEMRLKYLSPASRIREKRTYSIQLEDRLQNRLQAILRERRHNLALYIERMKAVSPLEKLNSGFSYVEDTDGKNIRSVTQVEAGERLRIRMSDGVIDTRVEQIQKDRKKDFPDSIYRYPGDADRCRQQTEVLFWQEKRKRKHRNHRAWKRIFPQWKN